MLSQQQLLATAPRRRPLRSLRQQYDLYIMDRVEQYKNRISREELMRLADKAVCEVRRSDADQFLLTEVLAQEAVDALIIQMLGIRGFEAWRKSYPKRRAAQREPIHWNLDDTHLVAGLAPRIDPTLGPLDDGEVPVEEGHVGIMGSEEVGALLGADADHERLVARLDPRCQPFHVCGNG